jgi:hypothetical protein
MAVLFRLYFTVLAWHSCNVSCDRLSIRTGAWVVPRDEYTGDSDDRMWSMDGACDKMIKGRLPRVKPSKNLNRFGQARARRANRERQGAGRAHETELPT